MSGSFCYFQKELVWHVTAVVAMEELESDVEASHCVSGLEKDVSQRHERHVGNRPTAGPAIPVLLFSWAAHFWHLLQAVGVTRFGFEFSKCLLSTLMCGLRLHTDYSGMAAPEEALNQIVTAASALHRD